MTIPSSKSMSLTQFLEDLAGRTTAIETNRCVNIPWSCGQKLRTGEFRTKSGYEEYLVSGLCQSCQDSVFYEEE